MRSLRGFPLCSASSAFCQHGFSCPATLCDRRIIRLGRCAEFPKHRLESKRLAAALFKYRGQPVTVLALPRGGVPVAAKVAEALEAPLDLILVRKVGVPFQPEIAMGAVADGAEPVVVRNEDVISLASVGEEEFQAV